MECLLIINPRSGKMKIKEEAVDIIEIFNQAGWNVRVSVTSGPGRIRSILGDGENVDIVVCCGGDGTLNETANAVYLSGKDIAIGYIPCGTTNDFATSMGIPLDLIEAAKAIVEGNLFKGDIGLFNGRVFVYTASFGMFTEAAYRAPQAAKNALGSLAYVLEGLKDLTNMKGCKARIQMDDEVVEDEFVFGGICNSTSVGGILRLEQDMVSFADGLMEVILVRMPKNIADLNAVVFDLVNGDFDSSHVHLYHASRVLIESEEAISYTLDGEYGDEFRKVEINVIPEGLHMYLKNTAD